MQSFSLLEKLSSGWGFPYRSKVWHFFKDKKSLCKKHIITEYKEGGLLPSLNLYDKKCKICLERRKIK